MATAVVDLLEAVQIQVADPDLPGGGGEPVEEQQPVGQSGERIVVGVVPEPVGQLLAVGDIDGDADQEARRAVGVADDGHGQVDNGVLAIGFGVVGLEPEAVDLPGQQALEQSERLADIGRAENVGHRPARHGRGGHAQGFGHGVIDIDHPSRGDVDGADAHRRALEDGLEARLRQMPPGLGLAGRGERGVERRLLFGQRHIAQSGGEFGREFGGQLDAAVPHGPVVLAIGFRADGFDQVPAQHQYRAVHGERIAVVGGHQGRGGLAGHRHVRAAAHRRDQAIAETVEQLLDLGPGERGRDRAVE